MENYMRVVDYFRIQMECVTMFHSLEVLEPLFFNLYSTNRQVNMVERTREIPRTVIRFEERIGRALGDSHLQDIIEFHCHSVFRPLATKLDAILQ